MAQSDSHPDTRYVTVCGTFNLALSEVAAVVDRFRQAGFTILSPVEPAPAGSVNGFLLISSDIGKDIHLIERRHLEAVAASDFVWLVAPGGYVGISGAAEVCFAAGRGIPVYTSDLIEEPAVACLVRRVSSPGQVPEVLPTRAGPPERGDLPTLIDPVAGADHLHHCTEELQDALMSRQPRAMEVAGAFALAIRESLEGL